MIDAFKTFSNRFQRDDSGALIIFGLILFVLMLMLGGLAVDLMRYENTRTNLQNTLDRSVLAAAALTQKRDPESVVRDYMLKAGLKDQLSSVNVSQALNSRTVAAVGVADIHPLFLHMLGIDKFDARGRSQAYQTITNVEIVLVLDVSGSMANNNKINNLKTAATEFVDTILTADPEHRVSIAIVPYNAQVNVGADLASAFTVNNPNGVSNVNCFEPARASFGTSLAISRTAPLSMTAYADYSNGTDTTSGYVSPTSPYAVPQYGGVFCKQNTYNAVKLPSTNAATIKANINALQAQGNTSITLGMKWGATMLDPSMRSAYAGFIAQGKMPASQPARPFDYSDPQALKFVILMTDGAHVEHYRVVDQYKYGPSRIYRSAADGQYSVRCDTGCPAAAGANRFYVPQTGTWQATPWNGGVEQGWQDIWKQLKLSYVVQQFYTRPYGITYNTQRDAMVKWYASRTDMDASLNQTCDFVKGQGVTVYGIAFEAPPVGQTAIRNCSTDPVHGSHYFAADGLQIQTAFRTIAANLSMLKLTQ
ncbi:MAG: hypothetical protein H7317_17095 [Pseudorhodobacter sp.]|nr:hypothetical protein [Pseudorhodobacter sp.]